MPDSKPQSESFEVVAMYDYTALESDDLPLTKGERVVIFDNQRQHRWKARNAKGSEGYVPANYVQKIELESKE